MELKRYVYLALVAVSLVQSSSLLADYAGSVASLNTPEGRRRAMTADTGTQNGAAVARATQQNKEFIWSTDIPTGTLP